MEQRLEWIIWILLIAVEWSGRKITHFQVIEHRSIYYRSICCREQKDKAKRERQRQDSNLRARRHRFSRPAV